MTEGEAATLRYVRAAIASLPGELTRALECPLPRLARAPRTLITTGIGASEGPARILAGLSAEAGLCARFCPVSAFSAHQPTAELLVCFSQGLSPNAHLALAAEHAFTTRWLVTSVDPSSAPDKKRAALARLVARRIVPIVIPPADEPESLARFVGPSLAALTAMRLAALLSGDRALATRLADAPAAYATLHSRAAATTVLEGALAFVHAGPFAEASYAHRWKVLETLLNVDPPVWDALQFAHGPLQACHGKPLTLLLLEAANQGALFERLSRTLSPARHRVLRLAASLPAPLSFFQHAAALDALLLATLEQAPRDLFDWPGRHGDKPLYELGDEP